MLTSQLSCEISVTIPILQMEIETNYLSLYALVLKSL